MIVEDLEKLIISYNDTLKCGLNWEFTHARKDYANLKSYDCDVVHFILHDYEKNCTYRKEKDGHTLESTIYTVNFFVGTKSKLDNIIYNECKDADKLTGKYNTHVKPLDICFSDFDFDICEYSYDMNGKHQGKPAYNYLDSNLDGLPFVFKLKIYHQ